MRPFAVLVVAAVLASPAAADRTPAPAPAHPAVPPRPTAPPATPPATPAASPAPAGLTPPALTPINPAAVPEPCRSQATQAAAPRAAPAARVALASCLADRAVASLSLCDCGESILAIDTAAEPAQALLDELIDAGDPVTQALAAHAQGELYAGFLVRLVATLPPLGPGASDAEATLRDLRRQTLDAQLGPWREDAVRAFQRVVDLAKDHPELASNPAVMTAVRDSQRRLAGELAAG